MGGATKTFRLENTPVPAVVSPLLSNNTASAPNLQENEEDKECACNLPFTSGSVAG